MQLSDNLSGAQNIHFVVVIEWKNEYTSMKNALFLNHLVWNNQKKAGSEVPLQICFSLCFPAPSRDKRFLFFLAGYTGATMHLKK